MNVSLDPTLLPALDIVGLAQSGQILRAEKETPPDGVPFFVTHEGWDELVLTHAAQHKTPHAFVLATLEKVVAKLQAHAAEGARERGAHRPIITIPSDLFPSDPMVVLAFVRDASHPVACALIGTANHLASLLRTPT